MRDWPDPNQDATAPDPFILDDDFRLETLLNHVAVGRFFSFDLEDGQQITTVGGKKLTGLSGYSLYTLALVQGLAKKWTSGMVNFVPALA